MINRLFWSALTLVRALGALGVSTDYGTGYRGKHYHRDVQLSCQRFQTAMDLAWLLDAILVPLPLNTWLNQMQIVDQDECTRMHLDQLSCPLSELRQ